MSIHFWASASRPSKCRDGPMRQRSKVMSMVDSSVYTLSDQVEELKRSQSSSVTDRRAERHATGRNILNGNGFTERAAKVGERASDFPIYIRYMLSRTHLPSNWAIQVVSVAPPGERVSGWS